jgi:glycosyltransferase involved in cell wall biosynthesis
MSLICQKVLCTKLTCRCAAEQKDFVDMRALIVTATAPPVSGKDVHAIYRRLRMFVSSIGRVCTEIDILHFAPPGHWSLNIDPAELSEMQSSYWGIKVSAFVAPLNVVTSSWSTYARSILSASFQGKFSGFAGQPQVAAVRLCLRRNPDLLFVHRLEAMLPVLQIRRNLPPILFDLDDIEHRLVIRGALDTASSDRRLIRLLHIPAVIMVEYWAASLAQNIYVCSDLDKLYLQKLGFGKGVICVPNSIDIPNIIPPAPKQPTILFLGVLRFPPNADAADRLISRIWPRVRSKVPTARLIVAGDSPQSVRSFASKPIGVEFPGLVADLEKLYRESRVVCCPITRGGGTRLKLVEAAAFGKAMVSSTIGAEGLSFENGTEILIRDEDDAIADACVRLLTDDELCEQLGNGAHRKARLCYDLSKTRDRIQAHVREAISTNSSR